MAGITRHHRVVKERIASLKRKWAREGARCHLCQLPIDYTLPQGHQGSVEADHIIAIAAGGHPLGELAPSHRDCNVRRGKKSVEDFQASLNVRIDDDGKPTPIPEVKRPMKW